MIKASSELPGCMAGEVGDKPPALEPCHCFGAPTVSVPDYEVVGGGFRCSRCHHFWPKRRD